MTELLIIWAKFFAASALLLLFYWLVLRHRASYKFMRLYLITVPVLGIMMSGMSFDIPFQMPNLFERSYQEIEHSVRPVAQQTETEIKFQQPIVVHQSSAKSNAVRTDTALAAAEAPILPTFDVSQILRVFVLFVSLLLLLTGLYYIVRLLVIKSHMQAEQTVEGYDLIRSDEVSTPFSFAKTIFLPQHMDVDREEMIIEHEKAHIVHGHYIEVWFMELATRLLWFNPIVWLCRSELRNIHEYQADHDVISRGANVLAYQTTLLEMVLNESCPVVNGFNHSFIRRRFIEMKSTTAGTLSRLGKLSMIGWVALLFCAFTFRACKPSGSNLNWQIPEVSPQEFVLDISVDENILDSCYNIYLSDEYLHIDGETPDTCLQVVDKKCQLRIPLTKVIAGRVRCIFPGNELCSAWINLFFVPGETVHLTVHNGFFNLQHSNNSSYISKIERAAVAMRNFTDWKTPTTPTFEAIERFQTSFSPNNMDLRIHEVIYKEWSDADEFCENASKYTTPEETREKELEYLKEHGHEMGCISYFSIEHNYNPEVLLPFLSDECKESMEGKRIVREAEATRHRREEEARYADQPLYLMLYDVDPDGSPVYYQIALDIASIEQFQKSDPSLLLLKTYKGDDPDRPWSHLPRSKNGVYVYQRKE